ncbi:unnamed protein product [Microthlaspi erraticum]|uniref:Uncharacterized protein n=1 Tax=Microthlaspi erraticum TaxID=1685480 RepID=A0A6D2J7B6_9BRAS|nr:unnamed protein product [Microthlaspi erraticum]
MDVSGSSGCKWASVRTGVDLSGCKWASVQVVRISSVAALRGRVFVVFVTFVLGFEDESSLVGENCNIRRPKNWDFSLVSVDTRVVSVDTNG